MDNVIRHANIIFMPTISALGGIETYVYELVKKYKDLDIAVVSKRCDENQAKRIKKYCRLYIHNNQKIECKVAIINYDQSIIDYINKDAEIYQTIHADYTNAIYDHRPQPHPRVKAFIAITKFLQDNMKDMLAPNEMILSYNPLTVEETKPIIIVSATRLHAHKGVARMEALINEMDKRGVNYIWFCITNDTGVISHPNVIMVPTRLDISNWLGIATYVALFSDSEACSYCLSEALYRNIPILTTPLPYLKEIGVEDGKNAYIMDFDCHNAGEIAEKIVNVPKFKFDKMEDRYGEIFSKDKSTYEEWKNRLVQVQAIKTYHDMELGRVLTSGEVVDEPMHQDRAIHLEERGCVKIIGPYKKTN